MVFVLISVTEMKISTAWAARSVDVTFPRDTALLSIGELEQALLRTFA